MTDKKFPGNPTRSYRSSAPLKVVGEVTDWTRQTPEALQAVAGTPGRPPRGRARRDHQLTGQFEVSDQFRKVSEDDAEEP